MDSSLSCKPPGNLFAVILFLTYISSVYKIIKKNTARIMTNAIKVYMSMIVNNTSREYMAILIQ